MMSYRYDECGLDNVEILGMKVCLDDHGEEVFFIPCINGLHKAISEGIVSHPNGMNGKELRFLRSEMGLTQEQLASLVHHDRQSVGRWERGEHPIDSSAEVIIRKHAIEVLNLVVRHSSTEEISRLCSVSNYEQKILIDGSNPEHYKPVAA